MKRVIFQDFFTDARPQRLIPFIFVSSTFHLILFLLVISGFFVHMAPPVASYQKPGTDNLALVMPENTRGTPNSRKQTNPGDDNRSDLRTGQIIPSTQGSSKREVTATAAGKLARSQARGRVYNRNHRFVKGAVVQAIHMTTRQVHMTVTDEKGKYWFGSLKPGAYEIRISWEGLPRPIRHQVIIGPSQIYRHKWTEEGITRSTHKPIVMVNRDSAPIHIGNAEAVRQFRRQVAASIPQTANLRPGMPRFEEMFIHQHTLDVLNALYSCYRGLSNMIAMLSSAVGLGF